MTTSASPSKGTTNVTGAENLCRLSDHGGPQLWGEIETQFASLHRSSAFCDSCQVVDYIVLFYPTNPSGEENRTLLNEKTSGNIGLKLFLTNYLVQQGL